MFRCRWCSEEVEALIWDNEIIPVCNRHLNEMIQYHGEANLKFFMCLEGGDLPAYELVELIDEVNSYIKLLKEKYRRLLEEHVKRGE